MAEQDWPKDRIPLLPRFVRVYEDAVRCVKLPPEFSMLDGHGFGTDEVHFFHMAP